MRTEQEVRDALMRFRIERPTDDIGDLKIDPSEFLAAIRGEDYIEEVLEWVLDEPGCRPPWALVELLENHP